MNGFTFKPEVIFTIRVAAGLDIRFRGNFFPRRILIAELFIPKSSYTCAIN